MQFVVKGRAHHETGYLPYLQYLEHLRTRMPPPKEHEKFEAPYLGELLPDIFALCNAICTFFFISKTKYLTKVFLAFFFSFFFFNLNFWRALPLWHFVRKRVLL